MKLTCYFCYSVLVFLGVSAAIYAFCGFNLPLFLCFKNVTAYRCALAVSGICALFCIYSMIVFKPYKGLK